MRTPVIRISDSARKAFQDAGMDAAGDSPRVTISPRFENDLFFGPKVESDIVVVCDGITILLDPPSAARADGVSIDFVQGPNGSGFKFDNPNKPGTPKEIELKRECEATLIASGERVQLSQGERVVLKEDARVRVQTVPGVAQLDVEIVWDPHWDQSRMSEAARLPLGMF